VLTEFIQDEGLRLQDAMATLAQAEANGQWNPNNNAQTLWVNFKTRICDKARERAKIVVPKIVKDMDELKNKIDLIAADPNLSEEERKLSGVVLQEKLTKLEQRRHRSARLTAQVRNRLEGEVIGTYWTEINKPRKPRDLIPSVPRPATRLLLPWCVSPASYACAGCLVDPPARA
jgi:hypothetical protein